MLPLVLLLLASTPVLGQQGDAARGHDLYLKYSCYSCHSFDGHGGAGARLAPMKLPVVAFTAYVRSPRQMPPYTTKVLADGDLLDIWTFLKTIPDSPAADSIPALKELSKQ